MYYDGSTIVNIKMNPGKFWLNHWKDDSHKSMEQIKQAKLFFIYTSKFKVEKYLEWLNLFFTAFLFVN